MLQRTRERGDAKRDMEAHGGEGAGFKILGRGIHCCVGQSSMEEINLPNSPQREKELTLTPFFFSFI